MQYSLIRQALDHLYDVSLDLTVVSIENGTEQWRRSRSARLLQVKDINERLDVEAHGVAYVELQLASWLVDQLDAHTVAAIAWQVLRRATGIAKRLTIYVDGPHRQVRPGGELLGDEAGDERDIDLRLFHLLLHDRAASGVGARRAGRTSTSNATAKPEQARTAPAR